MIKIASTLLIIFVFVFLKAQDHETVVDHFDGNSGDWLLENYPNKKSEFFINYYVNNKKLCSSKNFGLKVTTVGFLASDPTQIEVDHLKTTLPIITSY